jgi:FkbM family methyltransferase
MNLLQKIIRSDSPKLKQPFRALCGYALQNSGCSERIRLKRAQYTVPFFAKSNMALTLWVDPDVVDRAEEFIDSVLKPGDTLIDVGANIGCVTIAGSIAVGEKGRVFSVEPHPRTYQHLQKTVAINHCRNVTTLNVALGSKSGVVNFTDERRRDETNHVAVGSDYGIEVPCIPLSSLVEQYSISRISALKIDVEGFEMHVLGGAEAILNRVDCICIEALDHTLQKFESSADSVLSFLRSHRFRCFYFKDDRNNIIGFAPHVPLNDLQKDLTAISDFTDSDSEDIVGQQT